MDTVFTAGELGLTYNRVAPDGNFIRNTKQLDAAVRPVFADTIEVQESFVIVGLSRSNALRSIFKLSSGGTAATVADPKLIFARLLMSNCAAFICAHNHPSGNTSPSLSDDKLTRTLKEAGKFLDLPLLDHVIFTNTSFYSYADQGRL